MLFPRDFARAEQAGPGQGARRSIAGDKARGAHEHLGDRVADYVDGMLDAQDEYRADLHLTVCEHCRYAVQQERAIIEQLRSVSFDCGGHEKLMAGLMSLASCEPGAPVGASSASGPAPAVARPAPALITSSAPPQYQSARRSMACALFAVAGCVGVALVAGTASGATQVQDGSGGQEAPGRAALVRHVTPTSATTEPQRENAHGNLGGSATMFMQVAARPTP